MGVSMEQSLKSWLIFTHIFGWTPGVRASDPGLVPGLSCHARVAG